MASTNDLVPPEILCRAPRGKKEAPSCKRQASSSPAGTAESAKLQAPSCKRQAPSEYKNFRIEGSPKQQASSSKPRPARSEIQEPRYI